MESAELLTAQEAYRKGLQVVARQLGLNLFRVGFGDECGGT
jgi:hypothetical protein